MATSSRSPAGDVEAGRSAADSLDSKAASLLDPDPERGFDEAFTLVMPSLASYCRSLVLPSRVDEVVHETYELAKRNITKLRQRERFLAWLCTIARHWIYGLYRQEKRQPIAQPDEELLGRLAAELDQHADQAIIVIRVQEVLEQLEKSRPDYSEILALLGLEYTYAAMADTLGISPNTVGPRLNKAKKEFIRLYNQGGDDS